MLLGQEEGTSGATAQRSSRVKGGAKWIFKIKKKCDFLYSKDHLGFNFQHEQKIFIFMNIWSYLIVCFTGTLAEMTEVFIMWLFNSTYTHWLLNLYLCTVRSSSDRRGSTHIGFAHAILNSWGHVDPSFSIVHPYISAAPKAF